MFSSFAYIGILTLLWIVNLFVGTGLDAVYHITDKARYFVYALFVLDLLRGKIKSRVFRKDFIAFGGMVAVFLVSALFRGKIAQPFGYLWVFILVYLLGRLRLNDFVILATGVVYGVAGIMVLVIYNFGSIFSGWNDNSIAMLGLHSFLIFLVPFFHRGSFRDKCIVAGVTFVYIFLLGATDSRGGMLFAVIAALFALNVLPRGILLKRKWSIVLVLLIPLVIVVLICIFATAVDMGPIDAWSYRVFGKPLFNGRDRLWLQGFKDLSSNILFGTGYLNRLNWHNSAIACLAAYGVLGYISWLGSFGRILLRGYLKKWDACIQGTMCGFLVLYMQQSIELGFIGVPPMLLAYIMLGLLLGRIRYLEDVKNGK